jgi:paraquat-inducible protein A
MLAEQGWPWLAAILITTIMVAPAVHLGGMIWVLATLRSGRATPRTALLFRLVGQFRAWEMGEVFVLGILISWIKLTKDATVMPGPSLVALVAFVATGAAAVSRLNVGRVWLAFGGAPIPPLPPGAATAREAGLVACHTCARLCTRLHTGGEAACPRCGATLHSRKPGSRERAWALLVTATLLYIPANVLPVMRFINMGRTQSDTILSGILHFIRGGSWGLALIIFVASVLVPLVKILVLAFLLVSEQRRLSWKPAQRAFLYRLTEAIGRWSMVDIFVISLMVAMVEMGNIASVGVGPGAFAFGLMVVTTMLAVHFFDPRLVWDALEPASPLTEPSHG